MLEPCAVKVARTVWRGTVGKGVELLDLTNLVYHYLASRLLYTGVIPEAPGAGAVGSRH